MFLKISLGWMGILMIIPMTILELFRIIILHRLNSILIFFFLFIFHYMFHSCSFFEFFSFCFFVFCCLSCFSILYGQSYGFEDLACCIKVVSFCALCVCVVSFVRV